MIPNTKRKLARKIVFEVALLANMALRLYACTIRCRKTQCTQYKTAHTRSMREV